MMNDKFKNLSDSSILAIDTYLCIIFLALIGFGFAALMTTSIFQAERLTGDHLFFIKKQGIILIISFFVLLFFTFVRLELLLRFSALWLLFITILLAMLFIPGFGKSVNGATSWFHLPYFSFQPSEPLKIVIALYLVNYFTKRSNTENTDNEPESIWLFVRPLIFIAPALALIFFQPDLGNGFLIVMFIAIFLFLAGIPKLYIFLFPLLLIPVIYFILYRIERNWHRVISFIDPFSDPTAKGYQLVQSLIAFYNGGIWGSGVGKGVQKKFRLPEVQTDFIYPAMAEEMGLLWSLGIIFCYLMLIIRVWYLGHNLPKDSYRFLSMGLTAMISLQAIVNLSVVTGLMPITGIPLPFISYGGSHLLTMFIAAGLICNVSRYRASF